MKFHSLAAAAAILFIAPTLSQDLASLPECAQSPILEAATATGCSLSDLVCICSDSGLIENLLELIPTLCTPEEVILVSEFGDSFCLTYASLTLSLSDAITNIPSTASADSASGTASGSAPATASAETTGTSASASETAAATTTAASESASETASASESEAAAASSTGGAHSNVVGLQAVLGVAALGLAAVI